MVAFGSGVKRCRAAVDREIVGKTRGRRKPKYLRVGVRTACSGKAVDQAGGVSRLSICEVKLPGGSRGVGRWIHAVVKTAEVQHPRVFTTRQAHAGAPVAKREVVDERCARGVFVDDEAASVVVFLVIRIFGGNASLDYS